MKVVFTYGMTRLKLNISGNLNFKLNIMRPTYHTAVYRMSMSTVRGIRYHKYSHSNYITKQPEQETKPNDEWRHVSLRIRIRKGLFQLVLGQVSVYITLILVALEILTVNEMFDASLDTLRLRSEKMQLVEHLCNELIMLHFLARFHDAHDGCLDRNGSVLINFFRVVRGRERSHGNADLTTLACKLDVGTKCVAVGDLFRLGLLFQNLVLAAGE